MWTESDACRSKQFRPRGPVPMREYFTEDRSLSKGREGANRDGDGDGDVSGN